MDGSKAADKALDVALDLAKHRKARVALLHVLLRDKEPEELVRLSDLAGLGLASQLKSLALDERKRRTGEEIMADPGAPSRLVPETMLREIGAHVLKLGRSRAARRRVRVEVLEPADGPAAPTIVAAAAAVQAEAIVMGSRGLRQIDAFTFGSVSREVCRLAHCTCIAVH
jgi:nucleotide-binding universal stress UspA family protein